MKDDVLKLIAESKLPPGHDFPTGVRLNLIEEFEETFDVSLTEEFRDWLKTCNGSILGAGGTYGIGVELGRLSIENQFEKEWLELKWVPIAGDGCGNSYVVDCSRDTCRGFVYFIDSSDLCKIAFACASDAWRFMRFFLLRELKRTNWPSNKV